MISTRRLLTKLKMSICHSRIEHFVVLCFLCIMCVLVMSWVMVERHIDAKYSHDVRKLRQQEAIEEMMKEFRENNKRYYSKQELEVLEEKMKKDREQNIDKNEAESADFDKNPENVHIDSKPVNPQNLDKENNNNVNDDGKELDRKLDSNKITDLVMKNKNLNDKKLLMKEKAEKRLDISKKNNGTVVPRLKSRLRFKNKTLSSPDGLRGGEGTVKVYSTKSEIKDDFDCIILKIKPNTTVCLYNDDVDVHVSKHLKGDHLWEPHLVRLYQNCLFQNPDLGVYDIGSHVGQYSLLAAVMGHKIVAVDPFLPNLRRLHKAIQLNRVQEKVIVVQNAVSDVHETFELEIPQDNMGGVRLSEWDADRFCDEPSCPPHAQTIFMDDLLEVTNFKSAIIKIDIEGHEHRAFKHSAKLFENVHIHYIFMEWMKLRAYYGSEADDSADKRLVFELIEILTERGFTPRGSVLLDLLDVNYWYGWPDDIVWQHKDV